MPKTKKYLEDVCDKVTSLLVEALTILHSTEKQIIDKNAREWAVKAIQEINMGLKKRGWIMEKTKTKLPEPIEKALEASYEYGYLSSEGKQDRCMKRLDEALLNLNQWIITNVKETE